MGIEKIRDYEQIVYIAGPYRAKTIVGRIINIYKARKEAIKWWKKGYVVICPHMNTALMDKHCLDDVWLKGAKELLKRSDIVVMLKPWPFSKGSVEELALAEKEGKRIIYLGKGSNEILQRN